MKVRIFPKSELVRSIVAERIEDQQKHLVEAEEEVQKILDSKIIRPGQDVAAKHHVTQRKEYITQLQNQLKMIEAHAPGEISVEIEL